MESAYDRRASQLQLAVIQPSPFCNIDCKYCYLPDRTLVRRMSPKIVEQSFRFLLEKPEWLASPFVIAWHAGQPLAVPMEFYESAFVLLHRLAPASCAIENWFQTNATLITQEWCDFIKRWDVRVGVSIDGPERIHDWNRRDRAGKGTFKRVFQGTDLLKANGIEFTAIGVLSQQSLDYPEEIWRFYAELGVNSLALNFEEVEGTHRNSSLGGKACT